MKRVITTVVPLGAIVLLVLAVSAWAAPTTKRHTGGDHHGQGKTITVIEHATTDTTTDTGAQGDSVGDILTFANEVYDADDKNKVGSDQGICFRTLVGKAWECFWTLSLDKGQITVEGPFLDAGDSVLAITGGTGDFAGAMGDMALKARGTDGKAYDFIYRIK